MHRAFSMLGLTTAMVAACTSPVTGGAAPWVEVQRPPETPGPATTGPATTGPATTEPAPLKPTQPAPAPEPIRFLSFGDTILTHRVGRAIDEADDPAAPFRSLRDLLTSVDFSHANFEAPLKADTPLEGLITFRFRALNLANNHIMDGGLERLLLTAERLQNAGIVTSGIGANLEQAWQVGTVEVRGIRIAFLGASYTSINNSRALHLPYVARIDQRPQRRAAIASAKAEAQFVVVAMHAGTEYVSAAVGEQIRFARAAIDDGADLVIGTHPHVVQPVERYRDRFIFYSLGNFIFDQDRPPAVKESVAVRVTLSPDDGSLLGLSVVPLFNPDSMHPQPADDAVRARLLMRLGIDDAVLVPTPDRP